MFERSRDFFKAEVFFTDGFVDAFWRQDLVPDRFGNSFKIIGMMNACTLFEEIGFYADHGMICSISTFESMR